MEPQQQQQQQQLQQQQQPLQPPNRMEQCLAVLTDILSRQTQQPSLRSRIEKELRFLPAFEGKDGTLPAFITSVDRVLEEYGHQAPQAYAVIYNEKILGAAKNYLQAVPPTTWEECKAKLKLQYRPTKDQGLIMKEISMLKVSSILELSDRIRNFVNDIAECAIFSEFQNFILNNLSSVLILKIKEITAGALAAELVNKFTLEEIRVIINKYIGQDQYNLKWYKPSSDIRDRQPRQNTLRQNHTSFRNTFNRNQTNTKQSHYNNSGQVRLNTVTNNSIQTRHNNTNNTGQRRYSSGQYRQNFANNNNGNRQVNNNNNQQVEPMEVDTLSTINEVNLLGEEEFFIN